ncbi:uncharacterized protein LOC6578824 [Drosophila mojavensis]|uniref:CUB domain-containing protein n=1 Tax=Drosophila mojavensis TaxID=7230 RepID=B4KLM6_DROMO|nr:uncharacterized protein LOC6578824 [Drosophila mojavensis]EDW08662.1 uncharacterized protein Dmoj_GI20080 [Drosophila mojavensis]
MLALRWFYLLGICACACAAQQELPTAAATGATTEKIFANQTEEPVVSVPGMWRQARRRNTLADSCTTNGGATGTCLTRFKCMRQGGTVNGYCGTYGVCCETNMACGTTTRLKRTIIRNPATFTTNICQYTIEAYSANVQQLRIDFEQFELQQPTFSATDDRLLECQDYFEAGSFKLCGMNAGQHLYLPFNVAAGIDQITLTFSVPSRWQQSNWRLIVTQLEAPQASSKRKTSMLGGLGGSGNSLQDLRSIFASHHADYELLAPAGCQQYYTELTGTIRSFNYQPTMGSVYMPETSYTICIKSTPSASMIEYSFNRLAMSLQTGEGEGYDEACHATVHTPGRQEDYLLIPQSLLARNTAYQPTYYCGINENFIVYASPPYMIHFSSDEMTLDATQETGFSLTYRLRTSIL